MPGWNQQQLQYKVLSGNSVLVMVGDVPVAFAQTSTQTVDFGTEQLYGIGTAKPQEIQQLKFAPTISLDAFVLTQHGVAALSYPSSIASVLANNAFDIHILDNNGIPVSTFVGCVATNYNQNVPVNAIVTETLNFQAMDVLDNTGNSILNGNFALNNVTQLVTTGIALNTVGL